MGSVWNGKVLTLSVFGESHGDGIGLVLDGFPAGFSPDRDELRHRQLRRVSKGGVFDTKRRESDEFEVLSGMLDGVTTGAPIAAMTRNNDIRSADYEALRGIPRPAHADFTGGVRYNNFNDPRGGGHFSGRLTAPWVFAGALCNQWLARRGVTIGSHIASIAGITDDEFNPCEAAPDKILQPGRLAFPVVNVERGERMLKRIETARRAGDSLGGVIECAVLGLAAGLGSPIFDNIESRFASLLFAIPAVRGVEFGDGFSLSDMSGSTANDAFTMKDGQVITRTNRHGGALGGITSGMPVIFRVGFKPTPSISLPQRTLDTQTGLETELVIQGRHDPCIVPRAAVVVESAAALVAADLILEAQGYAGH